MCIKIDFVNKLLERWREVGRTLSQLLMFVALNMQALRKIVKKQNKLVRTSHFSHAGSHSVGAFTISTSCVC